MATPFTAAIVFVPESVSPPGFAASATVTLPLKLVTVLPSASCAVTCTGGAIGALAVVVVGGCVKTSWVTGTATRKSAADSTLFPNDTQSLRVV